MILMRDDFTYVSGCTGKGRDLDLEVEQLSAGQYCLFVELDWEDNVREQVQFVVSAYGLSEARFVQIETDIVREQVLNNAFKSKAL